MDEELIEMLATVTHLAGMTITGTRLEALRASVDQACDIPARLGWEHKAAAHAEFFNVLADLAGNPRLTPVFNHGAGFAYDLMVRAGSAAGGIVANSRARMLACLRAGEPGEAALEMEEHLRTLHFMTRLAAPPAPREPA